MALIKCPECNHDLSTTAEFCPHCGYRGVLLSKAETSNSKHELIVLANRNRNGTAVGAGVFLIVFGALFAILIIGLFLIFLGINNISESNSNNNNKQECAYYDIDNRKIILYSYNGVRYVVKPEDIIDNYHPAGTENMLVVINLDGKKKRIDCGNCSKEGSVQFKKYIQQIKDGTFDPESLNY